MPRKTKDSKNKMDNEKKEVAKRSKKVSTTKKKESDIKKANKKVASLSEVVKKAVKSVSAKPKKADKKEKTAKKTVKKSTTKPKKTIKSDKEVKDSAKVTKKTVKKDTTAKTKKDEKKDEKPVTIVKKAVKKSTTKPKKTVKTDTEVKKAKASVKSTASNSKKAVKAVKKVVNSEAKAKKTVKSTATKAKKTVKSSKKTSTSSKATKKTATKSTATKKKTSTKAVVKQPEIIEYYDLPYRYNQTVVKILAQTPTTLFVYWDISDEDRNNYIKKFGNSFFDNTYPVLIIHNKTMNYSFEIEINDFANSWYFNVNDAKCDYEIELGRRAKSNQTDVQLPYNYQYVTSSNVIEAPNNHILFEKNQSILFFRNVKTNAIIRKEVSSFEFMKYIGKIYNAYNVYKQMYKNEELQDLKNNPSSGFKLL